MFYVQYGLTPGDSHEHFQNMEHLDYVKRIEHKPELRPWKTPGLRGFLFYQISLEWKKKFEEKVQQQEGLGAF